MAALIELAERGILPDAVIRMGIRSLDRKRLREEKREHQGGGRLNFLKQMETSPIALATREANEQHYEVPPEFFTHVLGRHLKYSGCYWPVGCRSLDDAEARMLALTCQRAELSDGMEILELGCGWGSLSLWMAQAYPQSRIVSVSNSGPQGDFIRTRARERGLDNLEVVTADMNHFQTDRRFDRVVSVEMFEHMRNWKQLLRNISQWLNPAGKLFVHVFSHRNYFYPFEALGEDNWMGRYFFTGGIMPSDDLIYRFQEDMVVEEHWQVDGTHYQKTAEAWLANLDRKRRTILPILEQVYGKPDAQRWLQRWRMFFMACAELWGFDSGRQWLVSHYRLKKRSDQITGEAPAG